MRCLKRLNNNLVSMTHYFFIIGSFNPLSYGTSMFCVIPSSIQCVTLVTIIRPGLASWSR